jgi:hypothetical protein
VGDSGRFIAIHNDYMTATIHPDVYPMLLQWSSRGAVTEGVSDIDAFGIIPPEGYGAHKSKVLAKAPVVTQ